MKATFYTLLLILLTSCSQSKNISLSIINPSSFSRTEAIVEIPLEQLEEKIKLDKAESYVVKNSIGAVLASQVTYNNKLIFQPQLNANETAEFSISTTTEPNQFESRTYANHHPERYDDFAWENDRIGFRFYGTALEAIQAPTSGLDLWYKRTSKIVLDEWYRKETTKEASYHVDHGEGCDPYAVGRTLGAGSMSPYADSTLYLNNNYTSFEIFENGPLRTTFKLIYPDVKVGDKNLNETKIISLDAGAQLTKITQEYNTTESLTIATGFPKRKEGDATSYKAGNNYFLYEEPANEKNGQIFLGIIIPQGIDNVFVNKATYNKNTDKKDLELANTIATTTYQPNTPITYYTGFGWNKFGFNTLAEFETYVAQFSKSLEEPLIVKFNK